MEKFVETYKSLYKVINVSEAGIEDFQRWIDISVKASKSIEEILVNKQNLNRGQKYSLETSLGHLKTIQQQLQEKIKKGGSVARKPNSEEVLDMQPSIKYSEVKSSFKNRIKSGVISNIKHLDFDTFMNDARSIFEMEVRKKLNEYNSIKINVSLSAQYVVSKADAEELDVKQFNTKNISIFALDDLDKNFEEDVRQKLDREMSDFEQKGSGWSLQSILHLTININKFNPLRAGCHIALPTTISNKHACINIKNNDKQCFKYAVLAGIHNIRTDA